MKPRITEIAAALSILVTAITLHAETSPLPPATELRSVFLRHMKNSGKLMESQPDVVRPYLDDMFWIADTMSEILDALDPLCRAYPQTDKQWRKESFLPYVIHCRDKIQGALEVLANTANRSLPDEVHGEARRSREDVQKMAEFIKALIVATNPTLESSTFDPNEILKGSSKTTPKPKQP